LAPSGTGGSSPVSAEFGEKATRQRCCRVSGRWRWCLSIRR